MFARRASQRSIGRYVLHDRIASGGMAAVHLGRLVGPANFARTVAVKRLHSGLTDDRRAVEMLITEARLAARLHHPNVSSTLDVVIQDDDAFVIMDYVHGESLARLLGALERTRLPPVPVVSAILCGALRGLQAAHEARSEGGEPLEIIHRDVSPQNIVVGADGLARLIDFGIAKARVRAHATASGWLKGKVPYLAPEQIRGESATRRTDIYAAGVVLWEALTGRTLFDGDSVAAITEQILVGLIPPPSVHAPELPEELDRVVLRAVETNPSRRFATSEEMAAALERCVPPASQAEVGAWVVAIAGESLRHREQLMRAIEISEQAASSSPPPLHRRAWPAAALAAVLGLAALAASARGPTSPQSIATKDASAGEARVPGTAVTENERIPVPAVPTDSTAPSRGALAPRGFASRTAPPAAFAGSLRELEQNGGARRGIGSSSPPAVPPSTAARVAVRAPSRLVPPPVKGAAATDDCDPPYVVDAAGIRIYKRRCLRP